MNMYTMTAHFDDETDAELFSQFRNEIDTRAEAAFHGLMRRYYPRLHAYIRLRVDSPDAADDVLQTVFIRLWRTRSYVTVPGSVARYLYSAARNAASDYRSSENARRRREAVVAVEETVAFDTPWEMESAELEHQLRAAIEALPPRCREIFILVRIHGLSYPEVTAILNVSLSTVKTQMGRAMAQLASALGPFLAMVAVLLP